MKGSFNVSAPPSLTDAPAISLVLALPVLLLHPNHVPVIASFGGIDVRLSDLLILTLVGLAVLFDIDGRLRRAARQWLWFAPFLLLLLISAATVPDAGRVTTSVFKLIEYFILGIGVTALFGDRRTVRWALISLTASAAVLGLIGVGELLYAREAGIRGESLIGTDSLGLLGAATLIIPFAAPTLLGGRDIRRVAYGAGVLCLIVAGSLSATLGLAVAGGYAAVRRVGPFARITRASLTATAVICLCIGVTFLALRWSDVRAAVGQSEGSPAQPHAGGSFVHRMMFADFGLRIWVDHPVLGVGYRQAGQPEVWSPYFASVRADFPGLPVSYFPNFMGMPFGQPTSDTEFGLHNVYSQLLAETGVVGLLLFAIGFVGASRGAFRNARRSEMACVGALLVLVVLGALTRNELYGGLPETTVLVLAVALAVGGSWRSRKHPRTSSTVTAPRSRTVHDAQIDPGATNDYPPRSSPCVITRVEWA